jgi:hypothetical protein
MSNPDFDLAPFGLSIFYCPPGCAAKPAEVWGSTIFYEKSSICNAAIFAGIIKDEEGGEIAV